ncbi:putative oxidoreductase [Mycobacterium tuberculosis]|nr:putative oxidoreductase [Mycobacterium tuberculosis]
MKIANEFTVSAPIEQAWSRLCDLEQMIPLMPGAQLIGHEGDEYLGKVKVKVGPVTSEFSGKVHFVEQDATSTAPFSTPKARRRAVPATRPPRSLPSCTRSESVPASPSTPI